MYNKKGLTLVELILIITIVIGVISSAVQAIKRYCIENPDSNYCKDWRKKPIEPKPQEKLPKSGFEKQMRGIK